MGGKDEVLMLNKLQSLLIPEYKQRHALYLAL